MNYHFTRNKEDWNAEISLWDTAGEEDYDRLRPLSYPQTDIFLICYSVIDSNSLEHVRSKWIPEIVHHCENTPCILVGCKLDLRDNEEVVQRLKEKNRTPVSFEEGELLAREIGAADFIECSSRTGDNVSTVFPLAFQKALLKFPPIPREGNLGLTVKGAKK
uniref:Uncharacterized protein n=1 Tax=Paramoeba aestuarina TaxID=180227 RepID=A0A7S4KF37_9EUKA|mmetsp:Transcript_17656/g.27642  ORF Transcript_17656/g.27642 Transcript_17656/m.27642 type:complete len:162 (+) Transcript_17656:137-622(+)|eukprot:CAMPEP_0201523614 /NCGR_PEP_ID=MMETSP0161_2-20130828/20518_1 /ASSEMBLY_ACC=CAM_ASM_000251 /TAXON_ID=180227 /ORGANISM="Neoparamoeba aestuarina, Strain SoJaBio B1-5/56/2" /LENGTH=161 /DNA_ID=CAMNT_0047922789 /DNA_START=137 /DNA_END=622 /DNA_ORIENTATION=+